MSEQKKNMGPKSAAEHAEAKKEAQRRRAGRLRSGAAVQATPAVYRPSFPPAREAELRALFHATKTPFVEWATEIVTSQDRSRPRLSESTIKKGLELVKYWIGFLREDERPQFSDEILAKLRRCYFEATIELGVRNTPSQSQAWYAKLRKEHLNLATPAN